MSANRSRPPGAEEPGWALQRLLGLHAIMRNDLVELRAAISAVADGGAPNAAVKAIEQLSIKQPGWSLRAFCGNFCRFVHDHHHVEDTVVFPSVLAVDGDGLREIVDRLEAEHRTLSAYVDEVERSIAALPGDASARAAAVQAVERLAEHLHAHLDFEEENLAPALNEVSRRMSPEDVNAPEPPAGIP